MAEVDYDKMDEECDKQLQAWRDAQPDKRLPMGEESGFEYGFQLGYEFALRQSESPSASVGSGGEA